MSKANTDVAEYKTAGYCLFEGVLRSEEMDEVRTHLDQLVREIPETMVVYKDGEHKEVAARPEYLTEPHPILTQQPHLWLSHTPVKSQM